MSTRLLNSISSRICRQNTQFNMYTTTSKQEEGCTFKDSHPKCFITTNFDKFHREAFARGGESRWCFDSMFPWYTKSKINSNGVCNYYDFIRREGLSLAIWFDIAESAFGENIHMTVKIFANVHQLMPEEVGQLSREFLDQSNRVIFYASWLRFLSSKFTQDGKNL